MEEDSDFDPYEEFADVCHAISLNWEYQNKYNTVKLDNEFAQTLGNALIGNTYLHTLGVWIGNYLFNDGAQAFATGIMQSKVKFLFVIFPYSERPSVEVLNIIYSAVTETIQDVTFTWPILDVDASAMAHALMKIGSKQIQSLCFRHYDLSVKGAELLAKGIRASNIKKLKLVGSASVDNHKKVLRTFYEDGILASSITCLSLEGCAGDMDALAAILHCFECLTVQKVKLDTHEIQILSVGLKRPNSIQHLELQECGVDNDKMTILSTFFEDNMILRKLVLSKNSIGDSGLLSFISNWTSNSTLEIINLENNVIGQIGAQRLLQVSRQRPSLKHLNLSRNRRIGYTGLYLVGREIANNPYLNELLLDEVTYFAMPRGRKEQEEHTSKINLAAQSILNGLKHNMNLRVLSIYDMEFQNVDIAPTIAFYQHLNRHYERSLLLNSYHLIPTPIWGLVMSKFCSNPSVVFYFLCELPGLIHCKGESSSIGN